MEDFGSALEKNAADLTVMDVYDIAAVVGQEFERIIDQYGCEALSRLMPKVVRVLEILEVLVSRNSISPETEELRLELDRLRLERMDRMEKERKHKKELELVEDVWRGEAQDLLSQITQLQEENKTLLNNLSVKECPMTEEDIQKQEGMTERERQVMKKLKEVVDKQRDEIRAKDRELTLKNEDIEALQQQLNRLMKINHDLRHKITVVEAQGKALIEQKVELEASGQARQQEMGNLRQEVVRLKERLKEQGKTSAETEEPVGPPSPAQICRTGSKNNKCAFSVAQMFAVYVEASIEIYCCKSTKSWLNDALKRKAQYICIANLFFNHIYSDEQEEETGPPLPDPSPTFRPSSRSNFQPESGIKRLFSFFSRDKNRGSQGRMPQMGDSFGSWAGKQDVYTEQAQEALQHM
uniref:RILP-like protein 1 n=2 Tax=Sinocyclocheilus grahami TaxID=75366 RepID=A0A672KZ99_SINGR